MKTKTKTQYTYILLNDLNRPVEKIETNKKLKGKIEYGGIRDNIKDVIGIARLVAISKWQGVNASDLPSYDNNGYREIEDNEN